MPIEVRPTLSAPHPDDLQGFSRDGWNGTYVTHLPDANHIDLLFLVIPVKADNR
jgi:hypothetical protein